MSLELAMPESPSREQISEYGRRVANGYILSVVAQVRARLSSTDAFAKWEVDAIADSVLEVLQNDGVLTVDSLEQSLHSRSIPKDLAKPLAAALSKQ